MLARLFVIVGGLFVLLLLAALVGPYLVDWSSYREEFEREASAVLGRKVTVEGTASARILPFPSVTFTDVSVGAGDSEPAMTVQTFSMDAELAPLLHGEFLIFDMRLVRPKVVVDIAADGTVDWAVRPSSPFQAASIAVENLTVTDGEVVLRHHASGKEHRLTDIDARLSARALAGPWAGEGTLNVDGQRTTLSASTSAAESGRMRLRFDAVPDTLGIRIATEGNVAVEEGKAGYSGAFHLAQLVPEASKTPANGTAAKSLPGFQVNGSFALDARQLALTEFRFETGSRDDPYTAEGKASLTFDAAPRFAIEAAGDQLRLDEAPEGKAPREGGVPLSERLAALEAFIGEVPRPKIPGTIDLNLPALVAGDTTIQDLKLSAEPADTGWRIRSLAASLPGRTTLEASGLLSTEPALGFDGSLLVAVAQPSGFAAWLGRDVDDAVRQLPSAGFNAKVKLTAGRQSFAGLEVVLGGARLQGSAESLMPVGAKPSLALKLAGGQLDLAQADAFASMLIGESGLSGLGGRDLDLTLKAGPMQAGGFTAGGVDVALKSRDTGLSVDRFAVTGLEGAAITASGAFSGPEDARRGEITAKLSGADLAPLLAKAAQQFSGNAALKALDARAKGYPGLLANADLKIQLSGTPGGSRGQNVAFQADGVAGGTTLSLTATSNTGLEELGEGEMLLRASGRSPDAAPLLALLGLHAVPLGLTGAAEAKLSAEGVPSAGLTAQASLTSARFSAGFSGAVTPLAAGGLAIKGPVTLDAEDIEPWLLTLGASLPGFGLGTPADMRAEADYADGLLVLAGLSGSLDEGAVSGDVNIALKRGLPEITGALTLDDFDLARAASVLLGANAFDEETDGAMRTPFRDKPLAPFTAAFTVSAGTLSIGSLGTLYDTDFTLSFDAARIAVGALSATYAGGKLKGSAEIKNSGGTGLLSAQFDLKGADVEAPFRNAGVKAETDLSGSVTASGKSVDGLIAGLNGSGTATLHDLTVNGINSAALPQLLAQGDAAGRGVDPAAVERFAPPVLQTGTFRSDRADFAYTVTGGVVRTPPWSAANASARLHADLRADLNTRTASSRGRLSFEPGTDALVGSEPAVGLTLEGSFASPSLRFDTAPLAQFLVQRTLEREQARVEDLQAALLEKQRLRREVRYFQTQAALRAQEAASQDLLIQAAQIRIQDRAALDAAEAKQNAATEEAKRQGEEAERRKVEAAIRLAESERAKPAAPPPEAPKAEEARPPVPAARELNLEALQPLLGTQP